MTDDRDTLLRFLDGELPPDADAALRVRLAREPALQADVERLRALRDVVAEARATSFAPYFSARVLRRLQPAAAVSPAEALYDALRWAFARTAVAGVALAVALGTYNLVEYQHLGLMTSFVEALFGLPPAGLSDALLAVGS